MTDNLNAALDRDTERMLAAAKRIEFLADPSTLAPAERIVLATIEVPGCYLLDTTAIGTIEGRVRYCVGINLIDPVTRLAVRSVSLGEYTDSHTAERMMTKHHEIMCHAVMAWPRV